MKRLRQIELPEDGVTTEEWWASKHQNQLGCAFVRSGKPSKTQNPGLLRCAECGNEVKVLVSPKRNPHSSKLGRSVSMKDHDLCRRCWGRLIQQVQQGIVVDLDQARRASAQKEEERLAHIEPEGFPPTAS